MNTGKSVSMNPSWKFLEAQSLFLDVLASDAHFRLCRELTGMKEHWGKIEKELGFRERRIENSAIQ